MDEYTHALSAGGIFFWWGCLIFAKIGGIDAIIDGLACTVPPEDPQVFDEAMLSGEAAKFVDWGLRGVSIQGGVYSVLDFH